ncbi:MAG: UDP-N-acetylmuramate--L-alanine ligase [Anaerolineaceae bacterium]|nr:UDP-N-acetylmuramate--L-alanine ligase [Anaerolineaceae bacterium]
MEHIHLIGIGGTGLSAIARVLLESGHQVSGSDRALSPLAKSLADVGVTVYVGHAAENVRGADLVVRSSAIRDDNPEVQAARQAGIPVLKRSEFLGRLMAGKQCIAVAGTHGKTTTTAMLAWIYAQQDQDPSYIIGGVSTNLGNNAHAGKGPAFVIEADEYDRMFLGMQPDIAVITYLEHDHPDCVPTPQDYRQAFVEFAGRVRRGGSLLLCADNAGAAGLKADLPGGINVLTYGVDPNASYQAINLSANRQGGFTFTAVHHSPAGNEQMLGEAALAVPGMHNVRNALAALAVAHRGGLSLRKAITALESFSGTGRRFEVLGEASGVVVVDDYAHHPTEIRATLAAARSRYPQRRIWAVWQPHTYSRTRSLMNEYANAFSDADRVVVTEIYAAREKMEDFSSARIVEDMQHPGAVFQASLADASRYLLENVRSGDAVFVLSAGDADQVSAQVLSSLREREKHHG